MARAAKPKKEISMEEALWKSADIQGMLPFLNNAQTERLQEVLQHTLFDYEVSHTEA